MYFAAMDTTVLEVETVESVPFQGRVVAILMGMGNLGVAYLRLLKLERNLLEGLWCQLVETEYGVILEPLQFSPLPLCFAFYFV